MSDDPFVFDSTKASLKARIDAGVICAEMLQVLDAREPHPDPESLAVSITGMVMAADYLLERLTKEHPQIGVLFRFALSGLLKHADVQNWLLPSDDSDKGRAH